MKKIIALILIVAMCLAMFTSCIELEALGVAALVALWAKSEKTIVDRNVFFKEELIAECREEDAQEVLKILKNEMEGAASLAVALVVEAAIGKDWASCH